MSFGHHSKRMMGNCDCEVISFKSPLEEALKCLSEFNMSCAINLEPKEKPDISAVGSYERNNDRKASSVIIVICQLQHIFYDQME